MAEPARLAVMDALRGFALLGVFLMNIQFFSHPLKSYAGGVMAQGGVDGALALAIHTLVQGKFWVLFALLFGMGFALLRERTRDAGRPFAGLYLRRLVLLFLFGAAHIALLWPGDILLTYSLAALGLLLPLRGVAAIAVGASLFTAVALLWLLLGIALSFAPDAVTSVSSEMGALQAAGDAAARVYAEGGFAEVTRQRVADYSVLFSSAAAFQLPMMLGVFWVGSGLVSSGRFVDPAAHRGFFKKLALAGLLLGLPVLGAALAQGTAFDLATDLAPATLSISLMTLASLPLALAYLALFLLAASTTGAGEMLGRLAPAGRMTLTLYLMQSLLASLVFFGYGFGLYGQLPLWAMVAFVGVVFALQLGFARWWFVRFAIGPLEGLWRAGTYLRRPRWRRGAAA